MPRDNLPSASAMDNEEYAVLYAVSATWPRVAYEPLVVQRDTEALGEGSDNLITDLFHGPWRVYLDRSDGIIDDFLYRNREPARLDHRFRSHRKFQFGDAPDPDDADFPKQIYNIYCLSRPGFSRDRTLAVVYQTWYAGPLAANAGLLLLGKCGDRWHSLGSEGLWVS